MNSLRNSKASPMMYWYRSEDRYDRDRADDIFSPSRGRRSGELSCLLLFDGGRHQAKTRLASIDEASPGPAYPSSEFEEREFEA